MLAPPRPTFCAQGTGGVAFLGFFRAKRHTLARNCLSQTSPKLSGTRRSQKRRPLSWVGAASGRTAAGLQGPLHPSPDTAHGSPRPPQSTLPDPTGPKGGPHRPGRGSGEHTPWSCVWVLGPVPHLSRYPSAGRPVMYCFGRPPAPLTGGQWQGVA